MWIGIVELWIDFKFNFHLGIRIGNFEIKDSRDKEQFSIECYELGIKI